MTRYRKLTVYLCLAVAWLGSSTAIIGAEAAKGDTERMVGAYLAMWSHDDDINTASVERFYAPLVNYYGKRMSRAQVLADKRAYIRQWPIRNYAEVPGTFLGSCNSDRSFCKVRFDMQWRRVSRGSRNVVGRARVFFEFRQVEGGRKIAKETARFL